jgi:hypothetical protein
MLMSVANTDFLRRPRIGFEVGFEVGAPSCVFCKGGDFDFHPLAPMRRRIYPPQPGRAPTTHRGGLLNSLDGISLRSFEN